jgi:hypothetical protein
MALRQHSHKVEQQAKLRELGVPSPQGPWVTLPLGGRLSSRGDFTSVPSVLAPKLQQCLQLQEMLSVWILLTSPSCPNSGGYPHSSTAASGEAYHADSPLNPHSTAALEVQPALPCPPLPTPCTRHPPPRQTHLLPSALKMSHQFCPQAFTQVPVPPGAPSSISSCRPCHFFWKAPPELRLTVAHHSLTGTRGSPSSRAETLVGRRLQSRGRVRDGWGH